MTQEEKAKAYDEALERAREFQKSKDGLCVLTAESIFPQLAESEDERIRRTLVEYFGPKVQLDFVRGIPIQKIRDWLGKQKELPMPNSTELIEMWDAEKAMLKEKDFRDDAWRLAYNAFMDGFAKGTCVKFEKQKEPHYTKRNALFDKCVENCDPAVMKKVSDEVDEMLEKEQKPAEWSEEDEKQIAQIERIVKNAGCSKMLQEKIHNWLESLRPQPKVDWGGEDEKWFDYFERLLEFGYNKDPHHLGKLCIDGKMWLKSLRPQPHWKPSEEQMKALEDAFRKNGSDEYRKTINSLYQDLKKLM